MPGSIFGFPLRPTTGQGMVWVETLGGRLEPGALSNTGAGLTGFTVSRIAFGSAIGGLEDSANLTFNGTTLAVTGAATVSSALAVTGQLTLSTLTSGRIPYASTAGLVIDSAKLLYSDTSPALTLGPGTGAPAFVIDGGAGSERRMLFRSGSSGRWDFFVSSTAEAGADAGSDFVINARTDAGATIDAPLTIARVAGGAATFTRPLTLSTASSGLTISKTTGTTLIVSSTAASTTPTSGCATFAGGLGIAGALFVGGGATFSTANVNLSGVRIIGTRAASTDGAFNCGVTGDAAAALRFGFEASGRLTWGDGAASHDAFLTRTAAGTLSMTATTASTTTGTGALIVSGGVGIAGALNAGGAITSAGLNSSAQGTYTVTDASTAGVSTPIILRHNSSGTPAANFGTGFYWQAASDTTANQTQHIIQSSWVVATHATRTSRVRFHVGDAAADREYLRGEASGTAAMIGFLGATAVIRTLMAAASGTATRTTFDTTTVTTAQLAERVKALIDDLRSYGLEG